MLSIGQMLRDRYRVDALPEGDSIVCRGHDTVENRLCAIKVLEGEEAARLEREAETLLSHRHPGLPGLYDAFMLDSRLYAVFEWPEGESLQSRLSREGRLGEEDATRWVGQVLAALDYIHTLNLPVARGGFTPAHIWIAPDGRARLYGAGVTEINAVDRSRYAAPEGGNEQRADVHAAGATLYTLLTGRLPEPASPRKLNPDVSIAAANVVTRALNHRPEARYPTIREMRKALGRAKGRAEKVTLRLGGTQRRPFPVAPAAAAILVTLVIAGIVFARTSQTAVAIRPTTPPPNSPTARPPDPTTRSPDTPTAPPPTGTPSPTRAATSTPTPNLTLQPGATAIDPTDNMTLVFVPEGEFKMGSAGNDSQAFGNEKPQHTVFVASFWIDQTEVTNVQFQMCVAAGKCAPPTGIDSPSRDDYYNNPEYADYPVIWVNWAQANDYCAWAGRRLPTEAEWEKAARGVDGRLYPWGDQPPDNTLLNFNLAAQDTTRVGSFPNGASPYGALDMAGNVVEWVDGYYYDSYFVIVANTITPTPSFRGGVRILRSSSWNDLFENIRVASRRFSASETSAFNDVGFRCAAADLP